MLEAAKLLNVVDGHGWSAHPDYGNGEPGWPREYYLIHGNDVDNAHGPYDTYSLEMDLMEGSTVNDVASEIVRDVMNNATY
jgi:hypothetical protein